MNEHLTLNKPLIELGFSKRFMRESELMGFKTIKEILAVEPETLITKTGFSYHWLGELVSLLSKHKLLHLLQPIPGKNYG